MSLSPDALVAAAGGVDAVLASVGEGISIQDPSGALIYANPAALRLMGIDTLEELLALPIGEVVSRFELFDADGQPFSVADLPSRAALRGEHPQPRLLGFRVKATGDERFALVGAEPVIGSDGRLVYVVNTFGDSTDQHQTERSMRFLAEAGAVLSQSLDYEETLHNVAQLAVPVLADWCIIDVVDADGALQRVGIHHNDPDKLALAEELQRRFPPDPNASIGVSATLRTGRSVLIEEISDEQLRSSPDAQAHGPEYVDLMLALGLHSVIIAPLMAGDRVLGVLTLVSAESKRRYGPRDLSIAELLGVRAGLAVQNSELYRRAEQAVQLRDRFLQVAAHELLTPVTIVRGYAQSLQRAIDRSLAAEGDERGSLDPARLRRAAEQLDRATERLTHLISDLLDVTRLQQGSLEPVPAPMSLSRLVASTFEGVRVQQDEGRYASDVRLTLDLPDAGEVTGTWDETRIEQVVYNMLDNALKYSSGGEIAVRVWLEGDEARLSITDEGLGIEADQLEAIFDPLHRTREANLRAAGMGMGLAVCREIVKRHGGWINAASRGPGLGATFTVGLPGAQLTVTGDEASEQAPPRSASAALPEPG